VYLKSDTLVSLDLIKKQYIYHSLNENYLKNLFTLLLLLFFNSSFSQELPPINFFTPKEYKAENQNWSISQGLDKNIYIANNIGLLEFNGARWKLYPSPNETILRSVKAIGEKIYSGSYMDFGYWKKNNFGILAYTSLSKELNIKLIEDEQFWDIIEIDNWILFQSLNRIYVLNSTDNSLQIIAAKTLITKMYAVDGSVYFQNENEGIYKIDNGKSILVTNDQLIKNSTVINIFIKDDFLLLETQEKGFYKLDKGKLIAWDISSNKLLSEVIVYNSIQLSDGSFLLGTISDGIIYLNSNGDLNYQINQNNGLGNNTVLSLFEDIDKNIWLGLDNGINYVEMNSPFKIYHDRSGELGSIYAMQIFDNNLYLGTNQGLFYKEINTKTDFKLITGTEGQVWSLVILDNQLFCGHNNGTYLIINNEIQKISDIQGTWNIKSINERDDLLLQGNYNGLNLLEKVDNTWRFKNKIKGFDNSSRYFEIGASNEIFVNHEYKGVFRIKIDSSFNNVVEVTIDSVIKGLNSSLLKYENKVLYAYKDGVLKYDELNKKFIKDTFLTKLYSSDNYLSGKLLYDPNKKSLWSFSKTELNYITPGQLSDQSIMNSVALNAIMRNGVRGYESIVYYKNNSYLLGTSSGYIIIDLNKLNKTENKLDISTITVNALNKDPKFIDKNIFGVFNNSENNINFSFNINNYEKYIETKYQYQLIGLHDNWSNWSKDHEALFENLPYGVYVFNVRTKAGNHETEQIASYSFEIERPWFLTNLAISLYVLSFIFILIVTHTIYRKYYKRQREKLLEKAERELALKEYEIKDQKLNFINKNLKQDIENKNKELASSTMSLIKKNEFLNQIKNELKNTSNDENLGSVIQIINKNINNSDDWKMFEEAFNNADKDFFKKVKKIHPKLTSNDLRLCMYLRMNLSSKEIAPLLNISPRSIEIKRYRLRKKINLERKVNLNDYFISL
jgi:hypothetical protein